MVGGDIGDDDGAGDEPLRRDEGCDGCLTGVAEGVGNGWAVECSPVAAIFGSPEEHSSELCREPHAD